jgi:tyrosyl-tRNA synthetase
MKDYTFLDFAREVGKLITVNYMMAKDSVKKRFNGEASQGMSFTEFTYQLLQGYDYVYLNKHKNCKLQMGGSDQWGNITTGTELIKKMGGGEAFALTCPLITKADGGKFGKTESGNIWLDRKYTSPYRFYQFWLNVSDDDAKRYIKIFTCLDKTTIDALIAEHDEAPHMRSLQKRLAEEVTVMVHSREDYEAAVEASSILFGNATHEALSKLDEEMFLQVFDGIEKHEVSKAELEAGIPPLDLLAEKTKIFPSKGEARKMITANGFSINKEKFTDPQKAITTEMLLNGKYILCQKGKKNYYIIEAK